MSRTAAILERLVKLRRDRNWTQAEMGRRIALTEEAYRSLEKGRTIRLEWNTIGLLTDLVRESGADWSEFLAPAPASDAPAAPRNSSAPAATAPGVKPGKARGRSAR
jgi:transcriptional regulator with XRE-family HTH domain